MLRPEYLLPLWGVSGRKISRSRLDEPGRAAENLSSKPGFRGGTPATVDKTPLELDRFFNEELRVLHHVNGGFT